MKPHTGLVNYYQSSCCGVKEPSWSEIRHFVKFLDLQLQSCEKSVFTDPKFVGDIMAGLKEFVVKFMIRMSRVSNFYPRSSGLFMSVSG